jgi:hypothetical protein
VRVACVFHYISLFAQDLLILIINSLLRGYSSLNSNISLTGQEKVRHLLTAANLEINEQVFILQLQVLISVHHAISPIEWIILLFIEKLIGHVPHNSVVNLNSRDRLVILELQERLIVEFANTAPLLFGYQVNVPVIVIHKLFCSNDGSSLVDIPICGVTVIKPKKLAGDHNENGTVFGVSADHTVSRVHLLSLQL